MTQTTQTVSIYTLCDPETEQVRYVGATTQDVKRRLSGHLAWAYQNRSRRVLHPRDAWILGLRRRGLKPTVQVVEMTTVDDAVPAEHHWIAHYRRLGANLTNDGNGTQPRARDDGSAGAATCTTIEAANLLGMSRWRVWQLIQEGRLPAAKSGRDWLITRSDLAAFTAHTRAPGRPRKAPPADSVAQVETPQTGT